MWIHALLTTIPIPVSLDIVLVILQLVRHNVFVIFMLLDNSANVSNVPHSIKPFFKVTYIL